MEHCRLNLSILKIIFGTNTRCQQIDCFKVGKFECQKDIHFKTHPGTVAKNAIEKRLASSSNFAFFPVQLREKQLQSTKFQVEVNSFELR